MKQWYKGMDCSSLDEVERCGGRFFDDGRQQDCLHILKSYGTNLVRLRLWNDPYSPDGEPYGGGGNDIACTERLAGRAAALGIDWLLDFHYSDFWADPQKQFVPKAWQGLAAQELEQAVYEYTGQTLRRLRQRGLLPHMVSVGNEITNGLLWPWGKKPNFSAIAGLVSAGVRAVREVDSHIAVMLHLDNGGRNDLYREWFDHYLARGGEDFDCIGLSYYPFWHGPLSGLRANMDDLARRYEKPLIVAETSMGFSLADYRPAEEIASGIGRGMAATPALASRVPFPMTPRGQADFLQRLMEQIAAVPGGLGCGLIYWEPAWLPVKGSGWSTEAGCGYIHEEGFGGNEWANQALFDYGGHGLPALRVLRDFNR